MSSRGLIVAKYRDGYYRAMVCEKGMDVFPGGIWLLRKYNGLPEIDKLFEKSHLDALGATLDECHSHHEAMGAPHLPPTEFTSADQIFEHPYVVGVLYPGVDYIYLFEDGEWCVSSRDDYWDSWSPFLALKEEDLIDIDGIFRYHGKIDESEACFMLDELPWKETSPFCREVYLKEGGRILLCRDEYGQTHVEYDDGDFAGEKGITGDKGE